MELCLCYLFGQKKKLCIFVQFFPLVGPQKEMCYVVFYKQTLPY